jgi:hypothetical protein
MQTTSRTLPERARSRSSPPALLERVLADELAAGRVSRGADGRYRLSVEAFAPVLLDAMRALSSDVVTVTTPR